MCGAGQEFLRYASIGLRKLFIKGWSGVISYNGLRKGYATLPDTRFRQRTSN